MRRWTAWNHHDLEGFMAGYWKSPDLTFFSGTTETHGWEPTLERYRARYQAEGHAMGSCRSATCTIESAGRQTRLSSRQVPADDARWQSSRTGCSR